MTILAGPNGAGKSTLARKVFPNDIAADRFLNADDIARDLAPGHVDSAALMAGRALLRRRRMLIAAGESFVIETTLATRTLMRAIAEARSASFEIRLIYVWISDSDTCVERIAQRVSEGGHFIPSDTVKRRHTLGLRLLSDYIAMADSVHVFDNNRVAKLVYRKTGDAESILDKTTWTRILNAAGTDS